MTNVTKEQKMKIQVFVEDGWWHADFVGDTHTLELFGTTILPTPFEEAYGAGNVVEVLRQINPGKIVEIR
jgi:hypothetical protein